MILPAVCDTARTCAVARCSQEQRERIPGAVALGEPLLHWLVDEGVLAIWHEGPPPGRKGRLYALTAQGARRLAELRCRVREAGQRALAAATADLDALAAWPPESLRVSGWAG